MVHTGNQSYLFHCELGVVSRLGWASICADKVIVGGVVSDKGVGAFLEWEVIPVAISTV